MNRLRVVALALFLFACSSPGSTFISPEDEIQRISALAGFPPSEVAFTESTRMLNSPTGDLPVDLYEDEQGRKFYFNPAASTVVEIDARALLPSSGEDASAASLTPAELEAWAVEFVVSTVPEFASLEDTLTYESGAKGDMQFFSWRAENPEGLFMPLFIQVGLTASGDLFAFYNTVTLTAD